MYTSWQELDVLIYITSSFFIEYHFFECPAFEHFFKSEHLLLITGLKALH